MKPRYAAMLALVGWYLMVPPVISTGDGRYTVDLDLPLSKWVVNNPFDSASECDALETQMTLNGDREAKKYPKGSFNWALAARLTQCQCISAGDPRLAK